jgi:hypothetical protein
VRSRLRGAERTLSPSARQAAALRLPGLRREIAAARCWWKKLDRNFFYLVTRSFTHTHKFDPREVKKKNVFPTTATESASCATRASYTTSSKIALTSTRNASGRHRERHPTSHLPSHFTPEQYLTTPAVQCREGLPPAQAGVA